MMRVASQHNIIIWRILITYKDYANKCSKDMPTLPPHLSRHPKEIREEQRVWLEEHKKRVRGNDRVSCREEPHILYGSTQFRKKRVRPRARKNRDSELNILNAYIETNLGNGFILQSSPAAVPISFAKKKDSGQRLCVIYRALNETPECLFHNPIQGRRQVQHYGTGSSSTKSCRLGCGISPLQTDNPYY